MLQMVIDWLQNLEPYHYLLVTLCFSFAANLLCFKILLKKPELAPPPGGQEDPLSGENKTKFLNDLKLFLNMQAKKTSGQIALSKRRRLLEKNVIGLRTAYLKIEASALRHEVSSEDYWRQLNDKLTKLLLIFLPKIVDNKEKIANLERKVKLLKDRIQRLTQAGDSKAEESIASLDAILDQCKSGDTSNVQLDKYADQIETAVRFFEEASGKEAEPNFASAGDYVDNTLDTLDALIERVNSQTSHIAHLEAELKNRALEDALKADEGPGFLTGKLTDIHGQNTSLQDYINELKEGTQEFKQRFATISTKSQTDGDSGGQINTELLALSEEIIFKNEKEIDRLRTVIREQKTSLITMEQHLRELEESVDVNTTEGKLTMEEITVLRRHLEESETCISMLENELDMMKQEIHRSVTGEPTLSNEENIEILNQSLENIKAELEKALSENSLTQAMINFVKEALDAGSVEDISLLIFQTLSEYNCSPSLLVHSKDRVLELASSGSLKPRDKILINNMQIHETNLGAEGRSVSFRLQHIGGILRADNFDDDFAKRHTELLDLLKIADKMITKVSSAQSSKSHKRTVENCSNTIKKMALDVDKSYEAQLERSKQLIKSSIGQIQDIAKSKGLNASQIAAFKRIEQEALREIYADDAFRLTIRRQFLALLKEFEQS